MTVKGHCRTNLDGYHGVHWPTNFVAVPVKGQRILSTNGMHSLRVVDVTHCEDKEGEPYIQAELHREKG